MKFTKIIVFFSFSMGGLLWLTTAKAAPLPTSCQQVLIAIPASWNSPKGELRGYHRENHNTWRLEFGPVPALFGKHGLAWGIGIAGQGQSGLQKKERDGRSPAGIFKIGRLYTYDRTLPRGVHYPFSTMTERDVWISNPASPDYNRHLLVNLKNLPSWYTKERMKLGDPPHRYMLEIRHNADKPVPNAGSAIFFHIRRGPETQTAGCTTLEKEDLLKLLRWLKAQDSPCYVLLPREVYKAKQSEWKLPPLPNSL